jgi:DNA topoisomerase-1
MDGRYGPYVTDGQTNASLPKTADPAALTLEQAMELLKARAESGPPAKRPRGRTTTGTRRAGGRSTGTRKRLT